ncbi:MAG TPA: Ppx/GppA phosphatase family protein [Candidatus Kapabacteria bacterium]|nr:Ppx/GppA phosphatase family protein [Candidatus Kapabacteria bacterium]
MRIAAIDLGTNSFHLVIADTKPNGSFRVVSSEKEMVRLGESGADMKFLTPEAMKRGMDALRRFKTITDARGVKAIRAIATSAIREAENQDDFIRKVKSLLGISVEVVSGFEEGRLVYLGVLQALPLYNKRTLAVDIGGGSSEYVLGEKGNPKFIISHKLGAIRLTKHFNLADRPTSRDISNARNFVIGELAQTAREISKRGYNAAAFSSGTALSVAAMIAAARDAFMTGSAPLRMNSFTLEYDDVREIVRRLIASPTAIQRKRISGLDEKRADIILGGAIILEESMRLLGVKRALTSSYALREGIIYDYIRHHRFSDGTVHRKIVNVREQSVRHLGEQCNYDEEHSNHISELALSIFDQTRRLHHLSSEEREFLHYASLLHDIGYHISHSEHHLHSYYIISHSDLLGFTNEEIELIANIARYHRKSHPKLKHEGFLRLQSDEHRDLVRKLAAILRIAEGLDRGNIGIVRDVKCSIRPNKVEMQLRLRRGKSRDAALEIWGADRKKTLFEEVYGREVRFS